METWCEENKISFNTIWKVSLKTSSKLHLIEKFIRMRIGIIKKCRMKNLSTAKKSSRRDGSSSKNEKSRNKILRKKSDRKNHFNGQSNLYGDFVLSSHKKGSMRSREEESEIGSIAIVSRKGSPNDKIMYNTEGNQFDSLKDFRSRLLDASVQNRELPKVPSEPTKYQTVEVPRSPKNYQKKRKEFDFKFEEFKMNDFLKTEMNM